MTTSIALSPAFYVAMALYAAASLAYFAVFFEVESRASRVARWLLIGALAAHAVDIAMRDLSGVSPGTSIREALGAVSFFVAAGYVAATFRYRLAVIGGFVAPIAMGVLCAARLTPSGTTIEGISVLGKVHISLATLGIAIFALATAVGAVYLLEARNLKNKRFDGVLFRRGVALETLDDLLHRLVLVGFPVYTSAMMLGAVWASQRSVAWYSRPEYAISMVTWVAFGGLLLARVISGWRGRRAAMLTIAGFAASVIVVLIYLVRRMWG